MGNCDFLTLLICKKGKKLVSKLPNSPTLLDAIADMLMPSYDGDVDFQWDDEHHQETLDKALEGYRPLSEIILEERQSDR
jgi:hypothetical protein